MLAQKPTNTLANTLATSNAYCTALHPTDGGEFWFVAMCQSQTSINAVTDVKFSALLVAGARVFPATTSLCLAPLSSVVGGQSILPFSLPPPVCSVRLTSIGVFCLSQRVRLVFDAFTAVQ